MTHITEAYELQALIKHHAECIVEWTEDNDLKPCQTPTLILTIERMLVLARDLEKCSVVSD